MLSVVIPFYNESGNIPELFRRLDEVLSRHAPEYEVIGVDDGSRDDTFLRLLAEREKNPRIKLVRLSRNFGKEIALSAGLQHTRGEAVVTMDADLQHPPELIPEFLAHWREGYKMVYAARQSAQRETWLHTLFAKVFYWLFAKISHLELPKGAGDFRLLDRRVVDALNAMPERTRFMKGLFAWVGFSQIGVPFVPPERFSGKSGFSFHRLWHFAIDGVAAFSTVPLRVWSLLGLLISALSLIYGAFLVIRTLAFGIDVPGYASLMVSTLFIGGIQLISLGVIGEYLGRVFEEVKHRPLYLISETHGLDNGPARPNDPPSL
ncbi:MAG TPA: glycosyltransferase family 2 protein [Gammaproteobacteria bacterium]